VVTQQAAQAQSQLSQHLFLVPLKPNPTCLTSAAILLFFGALIAPMEISAQTTQLVASALKHQLTLMPLTTVAIMSELN
jgi:hypothetical protein